MLLREISAPGGMLYELATRDLVTTLPSCVLHEQVHINLKHRHRSDLHASL